MSCAYTRTIPHTHKKKPALTWKQARLHTHMQIHYYIMHIHLCLQALIIHICVQRHTHSKPQWNPQGRLLTYLHTHTHTHSMLIGHWWTLPSATLLLYLSFSRLVSSRTLLSLPLFLYLIHHHHHQHHRHHHHHLVVGRQPEERIQQEISPPPPPLPQMMSGADRAVLCFMKHEKRRRSRISLQLFCEMFPMSLVRHSFCFEQKSLSFVPAAHRKPGIGGTRDDER